MGTLTDRPQSHGIVVPACVAVTSQVFPQSHETENVIVVRFRRITIVYL